VLGAGARRATPRATIPRSEARRPERRGNPASTASSAAPAIANAIRRGGTDKPTAAESAPGVSHAIASVLATGRVAASRSIPGGKSSGIEKESPASDPAMNPRHRAVERFRS
jgi:hypothetical protein